MEFQEAVTKMARPVYRDGGSLGFRWKFSHRRPSKTPSPSLSRSSSCSSSPQHSASSKHQTKQSDFPAEFICPVSGSLMADPVIVSSGHSFDRVSVEACKSTGYIPTLNDGRTPDFSAVIPNLALKSVILSHCKDRSLPPPEPFSFSSMEKIVREIIPAKKKERNPTNSASQEQIAPAVTKTELSRDLAARSYSSSDESAGTATTSSTITTTTDSAATMNESTRPPQLVTRSIHCSSASGSSSEIDAAVPEEADLVSKLKTPQIFKTEEAMMDLRRMTREKDTRASLCTDHLLSELRSLIVSRYRSIQENSVAALVNLSLEKVNRVKVVRAGILPNLVLVLKDGSPEAKEHAAAAVFALALDDDNKMAIGALGALSPLVDMLRSATSEEAHKDSAQALYHLTLMKANCTKLVKTGSVQVLLNLLRSGHLVDQLLLIVCNLGSCPDGRTALLDSGGTDCLLGLVDRGVLKSISALDNCLNALLSLSLVGIRFKGLAKAARATEILEKVEAEGPSRKARYLAGKIKERSVEEVEEEEVDWEKLLESGPSSPRLDGQAV